MLAQRGVEYDHGQVYFRFLLRMLAGQTDDDALFGRFTALLGRMGIQIEVDEERQGVEEITRQIDGLDAIDNGTEVQSQSSAQRSRRASFSSVHNTHNLTYRNTNETDARAFPAKAQLPNGRQTRSSSRATDPTSGRRKLRGQQRLLAEHPTRGRLSMRASSETLHNYRRTDSVSSQGSVRITRTNGYAANHNLYSADESDANSIPQPHSRGGSLVNGEHYVPPEMLYRPSEIQMLADADTFEYHRMFRLRRHLLQRWRDRAMGLQQAHDRMYYQAAAYDWNTLLRQAFEQWRATLQDKRQARETERFFQHLEERAGKARGLFLLTKAFTHWAQCASDEVLRTSVARRHILRTRYFNAWRDITAVNELKVRRQALRRFLAVWRQRTADALDNDITAVAVYNDNAVRRVFARWYRQYCLDIFPKWRDGRLRKRWFDRWRTIVRQLRDRETWVEQMRAYQVQRESLSLWTKDVRDVRNYENIANEFRAVALRQNALRPLKIWAKLAPLAFQVARKHDARLIQVVLSLWQQRTQASRQAVMVNHLRMLRNAWTSWNDRLRCLILSRRIDDRVATEALFTWWLQERVMFYVKLRQARANRRLFLHWAAATAIKRTALEIASHCFSSTQRTLVLRNTLIKWRSQRQIRREHETQALALITPRITGNALHNWRTRAAHIRTLNSQADAARFYILTTTVLKEWRDKTQQSRRMRRREAYALVRRRVKMTLVHNVFGEWRSKTVESKALEAIASEQVKKRTTVTATLLLQAWWQRAQRSVEMSRQAETSRKRRLLTETWQVWTSQHRQIAGLDDQAGAFRAEITTVDAATCLRKLNWRLFQLQRQQESALALRERNWEKHVRNMLRYWAERAAVALESRAAKQDLRHVDDADQDDDLNFENGDGDSLPPGDGSMARAEEWSAFDDDLGSLNLDLSLPADPDAPAKGVASEHASHVWADGLPTSTPLPGYLRTPSKRSTARVKARERLLALGQGYKGAAATPAIASGRNNAGVFGVATAPAAAAVAFAEPAAGGAITPFEQRLRAQGYSERKVRGRTMPGSAARVRRRGDVGVRVGNDASAVRFAGFKDIAEDEGGR